VFKVSISALFYIDIQMAILIFVSIFVKVSIYLRYNRKATYCLRVKYMFVKKLFMVLGKTYS